MSDLSHLRLENTASSIPYTSTLPGGGDFRLPPRDRAPHAQRLIDGLEQARARVDAMRQQQPPATDEVNGYPLTLRSDREFTLRLESLDRRQDGMELLSVRSEGGAQIACVFVRKDKLIRFVRLIEGYRDRETDAGKPKNKKMVESMAEIRLVVVRDLWQDSDVVPFPQAHEAIRWEVWIRTAGVDAPTAGNYDAVLQDTAYVYPAWNLERAGIQDPGQAWNALTVGAYTEKVLIQDDTLRGWQPIASAGDLTPSSRTAFDLM